MKKLTRFRHAPFVVAIVAMTMTGFPVPAQQSAQPAQPTAGPPSDARWFVSDGEFIRRDPATPEALRESQWTLAVDVASGAGGRRIETAWLYRDVEFIASEMTTFAPDGIPLRRRRSDENGQTVFIESYRYRPDGTLREVRRCDSSDRCVTIYYGFPQESWDESVAAPEYRSFHHYDHLGRPEYILREEESVRVEEEWLTYDETGLTARKIRRSGEESTFRFLDGRVVSEEHRRNGRLVREVFRRFDEDGGITAETVYSDGLERQDTWVREEDGAYRMIREVDGVRTVEESRDNVDTGVTIRYEEGQEVVREYYLAGELQRREIIVDGKVERTDRQ